eukprot:XP_001706765.1 Hypothetical protein GL50803_3649 [Giardia lamblia ATCC 50803]
MQSHQNDHASVSVSSSCVSDLVPAATDSSSGSLSLSLVNIIQIIYCN